MLKTIAILSAVTSCFSFANAADSVVSWPSPAYDEIEDLMVLNSGYNARNFPFPLVPCTFTRSPGHSIAGGFLRTAFHDMAAADVRAGTGGLDASIGFEMDSSIYIENTGVAFNNTMTYFSSYFNSRATMSDLIALGVYASVRACGGPAVPLKAGRIDATNAGPQAVPDPKNDTVKMTAEFARMGFSPQEMIQVVACGHTLGGVHSAEHPTLVLPNTTALGVTDFDTTNSTYDNKVVTGYLDGTSQNPLVVGPDVDSRSDLRIFSSDGNKTVSSMADPSSYSTTCSKILAKMIDTVPDNVVLTSVITPYDVKPYNLHLSVVGDDDLQFSGAIRFKTTSIPKSAISSIQLAYRDRNGADGDVIGTTILGDASGFDDTFTFFGFNSTVPAKTSISSFTVVVALSSGTVTYDNNHQGFPVQDTVFAQTLNSNLAASDAQGNQAATLVAAVRKGTIGDVELTFSSVQKMTYNNLPTISKSTISMARACESEYYTFYSATYSIATAAVNGTKYDVSVGGFSDSFKSLKLPVAPNALSCQGGGNSWSNTTSSTSATSSVPIPSTGDADTWTTAIVTALTTYCPYATEVVQGSRTYTVTQATTLIITDCPCTVSWSSGQSTTTSSADYFATTISNLMHAGNAAPTATNTTSPPSFNAEQPTLSVWSAPTTLPTIQTYTGGARIIVPGLSLIAGLAIGSIVFL